MNWTYDPNQTGMPVVDTATGERICDVDCVDFYEICDDDEDKLAEYEARRDSNGRLLAAAPAMLDILQRLTAWEKGGDEHDMDYILAETHAILNNVKGE